MLRSTTTLSACVCLLTLAIPTAAQSTPRGPSTQAAKAELPADRRGGADTVDVEQCRQWLGKLASPEFEGRGTGQPGFQKAADYLAAHFESLGLEARGEDGSYFQHVPWSSSKVLAEKTFVAFTKDGAEVLRIPAERLSGTVSTALSAKGEVIVVVVPVPERRSRGEASEQPSLPVLEKLDVANKVVIAFSKPPRGERQNLAMARFAVMQALQGKNAAAVLFAQEGANTRGLSGRSGANRRAGNPAIAGARRSPLDVTLGGDDLKSLLAAAGQSPEGLDAVDAVMKLPVEAQVEFAVDDEKVPAMNVWAVLPGSDPKLKDEYVVIGSHLDHLGRRGDRTYPGADDDGSGTTGVMAVAKMFAKNKQRPARSVLFVGFAGEENGLIGSRFFAENCPIPLASIVAELQMDMIGRDEEENGEGNKGEKAEANVNSVHLIGTKKLAPALHELCLAKNTTAGFDIEYDEERMFERSDHANFARMGVPIAFFFTGLHRDYHQPSDTPEKINYDKLLRISRWVYDIAFELAVHPQRPLIDAKLWAAYGGKGSEQPAAPMDSGK